MKTKHTLDVKMNDKLNCLASLKLGQVLTLGASLVIAGLTPSAHAAVRTWSGGANDVNLSATGNWDVTPVTADSWTFTSANGTQGTTLNNDFSGFTVAGINFNAAAPAYTFGGNAFSLSTQINNSSSSLQTFGNAITFSGNGGATVATGGITFNGSVTWNINMYVNTGTAGTLTFNAAGSGAGLDNNPGLGATTGNISLRNNNAGTNIVLGNGTALGTGALYATADTTVRSNTSLTGVNGVGNVLAARATVTIGGSNDIEFTGTSSRIGSGAAGSAGAILIHQGNRILSVTNTGATTISGKVSLSDSAATGYTLTADVAGTAGTTTISGVIQNYIGVDGSGTGGVAGNLTKVGTGTLTLSGANTYTGNTTISAGTLTLAEAGSLTFSIGANGVNNTISGNGTANFNGTFNFNLSGANLTAGNSWSLVSVGTLNESFGASFVVSSFTENANVWTKVDGLNTWTFSEATGVLALSASVIPEPSTYAALAGLGVLGFAAIRRRRA